MTLSSIIATVAAVLLILVLRRTSEIASPTDLGHSGPATEADLEALLRAGRKIDAIKLYRQLHHVDLKTAKDAVERLAAGAQQP